ncbi:hypothetical protein [Leptospira interrogans]|uniref:hypothetical protein n=1 Tax=Leptospira interrogans TaxID=173 RepID=UPI0007745632|nr:hypothetical protein [Leptospira interrogans]
MNFFVVSKENLLLHAGYCHERNPLIKRPKLEFGFILDSGLDCDTFNQILVTASDKILYQNNIRIIRDYIRNSRRAFSYWISSVDLNETIRK